VVRDWETPQPLFRYEESSSQVDLALAREAEDTRGLNVMERWRQETSRQNAWNNVGAVQSAGIGSGREKEKKSEVSCGSANDEKR